jgi:hypothetical protein
VKLTLLGAVHQYANETPFGSLEIIRSSKKTFQQPGTYGKKKKLIRRGCNEETQVATPDGRCKSQRRVKIVIRRGRRNNSVPKRAPS